MRTETIKDISMRLMDLEALVIVELERDKELLTDAYIWHFRQCLGHTRMALEAIISVDMRSKM